MDPNNQGYIPCLSGGVEVKDLTGADVRYVAKVFAHYNVAGDFFSHLRQSIHSDA
jgi:hypothetical protein